MPRHVRLSATIFSLVGLGVAPHSLLGLGRRPCLATLVAASTIFSLVGLGVAPHSLLGLSPRHARCGIHHFFPCREKMVEVGGHVTYLFPDSVDYLFILSAINALGAQRIIEGINLPLIQYPNLCNELVFSRKQLRSVFSRAMSDLFISSCNQLRLLLFYLKILL